MNSLINFLPLRSNMKTLIKNIACQSLIFLLIVQTLNLSVNSLDFYTPLKTTNSIEDQDYVDSMIEFLVENVLGFSKDTFHDKANPDNFSKLQQNIAHLDLKWFPNSLIISALETTQRVIDYIIPKNENFCILFIKEVRPNPPQFLTV
jgi:hypothetical protein